MRSVYGRMFLELTVSGLCGCAVVRHASYSHPTADTSVVAFARPSENFYGRTHFVFRSASAIVSMSLQNEGNGFCAIGLLIPVIPWKCPSAPSKEFLHTSLSVSAQDEELVFDPARVRIVVAGDGVFTPECAAIQQYSVPRRGLQDLRVVFLIHRNVTGKCETGLRLRAPMTLGANSVDTIPPRASRSYQLLYDIRPNERRTLTVHAFGVSKGATVLEFPPVRFEPKTRWIYFFGDPF